MRAEFSPSLAVSTIPKAESEPVRSPISVAAADVPRKRQKTTKLARVEDARASVFVHFSSASAFHAGKKDIAKVVGQRGNIAIAEMPLNKLAKLSARPDVRLIEAGDPVRVPPVLVTGDPSETKAPPADERKITTLEDQHKYGENLLIEIIDVSGIAFAHPDFLDGDSTRILRIWDMGGDFRKSPAKANKPADFQSFDYGAEFKREHLNDAIAQSRRIGVSPYAIERQSQASPGSHGTHVASIAAGNSGICRGADIACVMLALSEKEDLDRRRSFYDSTRIAHAVEYFAHCRRGARPRAQAWPAASGVDQHQPRHERPRP